MKALLCTTVFRAKHWLYRQQLAFSCCYRISMDLAFDSRQNAPAMYMLGGRGRAERRKMVKNSICELMASRRNSKEWNRNRLHFFSPTFGRCPWTGSGIAGKGLGEQVTHEIGTVPLHLDGMLVHYYITCNHFVSLSQCTRVGETWCC